MTVSVCERICSEQLCIFFLKLCFWGFLILGGICNAMQCNVITINLMTVASVYDDGDRGVNIDDVTKKII